MENENENQKKYYGNAVGWLYTMSAIFLGIGGYKMFYYESSGYYYYKDVNAYVVGDAYNYIINSNYATAYYVLAVGCAIMATLFIIAGILKEKNDISSEILYNIKVNRQVSAEGNIDKGEAEGSVVNVEEPLQNNDDSQIN